MYSTPRFVSVNIFWMNNVLICVRGKHDRNYKKIYSIGGKIETGETPSEAAIRETFEEAGVVIQQSDLQVFEIDKKIGIVHYTVSFDCKPIVLGPQEDFKDEIYDTSIIVGVPTIIFNGVNTRWSFVNVHSLNEFLKNRENRSFATKILHNIYRYVLY